MKMKVYIKLITAYSISLVICLLTACSHIEPSSRLPKKIKVNIYDENFNSLQDVTVVPLQMKTYRYSVGADGKGRETKKLSTGKPFLWKKEEKSFTIISERKATIVPLPFPPWVVATLKNDKACKWLFLKSGKIPIVLTSKTSGSGKFLFSVSSAGDVRLVDVTYDSRMVNIKLKNGGARKRDQIISRLISPSSSSDFIKTIFNSDDDISCSKLTNQSKALLLRQK